MDELLTVGQVAQTFGVTVRTLHHYDEIGLLSPSERSHAGYRLYTAEDLERLATIVTYRRLDLPLDEVAALLRGDGSTLEHLRRQRDAVLHRVEELHGLVDAIDRAMEREMNEQPATHEELKEIFGDGFTDEYRAEAQERWGETDAWKQSARRTKGYTKADWERIRAEGDAVNAAFVAALEAGHPATSTEAMDAAEAHRVQIDTWFYDCSHDFQKGLADMYVADPRFTKTYEDLAPGLAAYVRDAIHANADRHA
ncbi:transcriptional regulator [Knoellia flava TL1]|uniref:MerR family transcriptional regulator n=2 Tax=Knoellia flava TaxID=913969 RepID=A0A8H9KS64_9MICO|nr:transcriptional regulator [Knoellia flava TL1]GGB75541.1 MerR family transcriptional regulator [Knoellia flava]